MLISEITIKNATGIMVNSFQQSFLFLKKYFTRNTLRKLSRAEANCIIKNNTAQTLNMEKRFFLCQTETIYKKFVNVGSCG